MANPEEGQFGLPSIGIPAEVLFHPKLTPMERILFGLIRSLAQSSRGCWASNRYLAKLLRAKNPQSISHAIAHLKKYGFLIIKNIKKNPKETDETERRIFVNKKYPQIYDNLVRGLHNEFLLDLPDIDEKDIPLYQDTYTPIFSNIRGDIRGYTNIDSYNDKDKNIYCRLREKNPQTDNNNKTFISTVEVENSLNSRITNDDKKFHFIFDYWNSLHIVRHKDNSFQKFRPSIKSALEKYSRTELVEAMDNYSTIVKSEDYYLDHKWTLKEFLTRALDKFLSENDPFSSYRRNGNGLSKHEFPAGTKNLPQPKLYIIPPKGSKPEVNVTEELRKYLDQGKFKTSPQKLNEAMTSIEDFLNWIPSEAFRMEDGFPVRMGDYQGKPSEFLYKYLEWLERMEGIDPGINLIDVGGWAFKRWTEEAWGYEDMGGRKELKWYLNKYLEEAHTYSG